MEANSKIIIGDIVIVANNGLCELLASPIRLYIKNYGASSIVGIPRISTGSIQTDGRIISNILTNAIKIDNMVKSDLEFERGNNKEAWKLFIEKDEPANITERKPRQVAFAHLFNWLRQRTNQHPYGQFSQI